MNLPTLGNILLALQRFVLWVPLSFLTWQLVAFITYVSAAVLASIGFHERTTSVMR
jgi:hypothetical protein